ncbi:hypothetical protein PCASD_02560 [Puccinia coronata f. sp. avenae]|uniref:Uncharacterized protein n=1 Tax=Puccinia coronata f. sp. avenae TaxID=200324 RepID=A0A2N5VBM6_9BASI|nr:hypothetical protein PCASD_08728 [Puccinia coronata f. sp. avenae]PLW47316.1 hypothetical protein PCASD_02560 [Puccinia coronata f. sp. avenae]
MYNPELGVCLVLSSSSPCFTHPIDFKLLCVSCLFLLIRPVEQPSLLRNRSSRNQEDLLLKDISTWLAKLPDASQQQGDGEYNGFAKAL